jgi:hypothetical protein
MISTKQLETRIGNLLKGAPALPESTKKSLVEAWPWIAVILGVLQVISALALWSVVSAAERAIDVANTYSLIYNGVSAGLTAMDKTVIYLAIIVLVVSSVILFKAYPELKKQTKRGWDLLFLGSLVNVVYAVITLFINQRGVSSFVFSLIGSVIGFYLLFQVREKYHTTK